MKKRKRVLSGVLLLLLALLAGVGIWQRQNIRAVFVALTQGSDQIAQTWESNRENFHQTIQSQTQEEVVFTPPTIQQSEAILNGSATADQIKEELGLTQKVEPAKPAEPTNPAQPTTPEKPVQPSQPVQQPEQPVAPPVQPPVAETPPAEEVPLPPEEVLPPPPTAQELVNSCVAELTVCEVDLMAQLGGMKQAAIDQWNALDPKERTATRKKEIGLAGLEECYKLEVVIDNKVIGILDRYEVQLKEIGADVSVLDTLWDYYQEEKSSQKAYYLNKYMD